MGEKGTLDPRHETLNPRPSTLDKKIYSTACGFTTL